MRLHMLLMVGTPHRPFFTDSLHEGTDLPHICKGREDAVRPKLSTYTVFLRLWHWTQLTVWWIKSNRQNFTINSKAACAM